MRQGMGRHADKQTGGGSDMQHGILAWAKQGHAMAWHISTGSCFAVFLPSSSILCILLVLVCVKHVQWAAKQNNNNMPWAWHSHPGKLSNTELLELILYALLFTHRHGE